MSAADEIIQEFLVETHDSLGRLDGELVAMEKGEALSATLGSVFRTMHTLKGSAGFLGFQKLESLTHVAESLLSRLRDGKLTVTAEIITALLETVDAVRAMVRSIELDGRDGDQTYPELIARLKALTANEPPPATPGAQSGPPQVPPPKLDVTQSVTLPAQVPNDPVPPASSPAQSQPVRKPLRSQQPAPARVPMPDRNAAHDEPGTELIEPPIVVSNAGPVAGPQSGNSNVAAQSGNSYVAAPPESSIVAAQFGSSIVGAMSGSSIVTPSSGSSIVSAPSGGSKVADSTIRLGVERVDKMMNLVTELVLSRNQILQHEAIQTSSTLAAAARNLNLITSELQESVMRMRMQPINNVWSALPRVVRDLSLECGKQVRLVMDGADTELDKSVLEAIKDPLTHLVRNAIDHGLETPDERTSRGKPVEGMLRLRAYHESGHVHIEISDDGAGIDHERVKLKAHERGLLTLQQAEALSGESVLSLIFLPGFSTRDAVSSLSGRGVGMDVVKSNVERIGGVVDVQSTPGTGTTFKMRIPLTLAIIQALLVTCADERYAIPQSSMRELIRLEGDRLKSEIERIHGVRVHRYRGKLLPLVPLAQILGGTDEIGTESVNIIVLQADQRQFGLIVDRVNDSQEIVVKPLHKLLRGITCLSGATILGDGQVALILDVAGLADQALGEARQLTGIATDAAESATPLQDMQQVVLVSGPRGERLAVPLSEVTRLEEVPVSKVEWTGSRPVIQYRGGILPLVDVMGLLERLSAATETGTPIQVVVCSDGNNSVGLIVGRILDIVTDPLLVRASSAREHVLFTAVVQQQVTEVLNVTSLVCAAEAEFVVSRSKA